MAKADSEKKKYPYPTEETFLKLLDEYVRPGHKPPEYWKTYNIKQLMQELYALESMCKPIYEPDDPELFNPHLHPELVKEKRRMKMTKSAPDR